MDALRNGENQRLPWWRRQPSPPALLPGRKPGGSGGPPRLAADDPRPARRVRAVCCSGGGIRSAAFALGGFQALGRRGRDGRSWYDGVDLVTAVSGGSYIAGSLAIVDDDLSDAERAALPAYAPGSPEDRRLRAHTRYLAEDPKVAALGVLHILFGLVLNLIPILAGLYLAAKALGWSLHHTGVLWQQGGEWQVRYAWPPVLLPVLVAAAGLLLFGAARLHDVYRPPGPPWNSRVQRWALGLFGLAALLALILIAVPALLRLLSASQIDLDPRGLDWRQQVAGFAASTAAIVTLVKGTLGRFKAKLLTGQATEPTRVSQWTGRAWHAIAPWFGSAAVVGLLLVAFLVWTGSAAHGVTAEQLAGCAVAVLAMVGWQFATDVNRNSIHPFYRERLSSAFAVRRTSADTAETLPYSEPIPFSGFDRPRRPALVVCAAVNNDEVGVVPSGRGCAPFTFSARWTGISSGVMFEGEENLADPKLLRPTKHYERLAGRRLLTLPAAIAVSGAAVSPVMGRMTRAPLRLLLGLANVRLGLWLPNPDPKRCDLDGAPPTGRGTLLELMRYQGRQPGVRALLAEILGRTDLRGRWVYVTDGGHYENLGLVEALRRGSTEIVAFDASGDRPHTWTTFGQAVETARSDLGVEIDLDPSTMAPLAGGDRTPTLVVRGTCTYPNGMQADLLLCKLALPVKASWDVFAWHKGHPGFPHDTTLHQLYGDREFEAYRRLGEIAADTALEMMATSPRPVGPPPRPAETPPGETPTAEKPRKPPPSGDPVLADVAGDAAVPPPRQTPTDQPQAVDQDGR